MKTVLEIRIWDEELEDFKNLLQNDFLKHSGNKKFESLLLRDSDDSQFKFVKNLSLNVLNDNDILVKEYKKNRSKANGDFFIVIDLSIEEKFMLIYFDYVIEVILRRLILLMNLTYDTAVDFMESISFDDNFKILKKHGILISDLNLAYQHSNNINWPTFERITLNEVIEMFSVSNYSLEGVSKNDFHRAVNCFSHIFCELFEKGSGILFWNMVGIEGLLAKGNKDIQAQIRQKSSLVLGEPTEYKRKINQLYIFRSKLVHGELHFPSKFSDDYNAFEEEYWDYNSFATSILLSLIKHLIKNKKYQFEFEYNYML